MDKKFWGILGGLIIIAIALAVIFSGSSTKTNAEPSKHIMGSGVTGVRLLEYGDYQCPHCGNYYATVKAIGEKYKNLIQVQFRSFNLAEFQNSRAASRAAEAAAMQDKFWEMHDKLYEENVAYYNSSGAVSTWVNADDPMTYFTKYAKQIGLDITKFRQDFRGEKVNDIIQADNNRANDLHVGGTPTFFLDSKQLELSDLANQKTGEPSLEKFSKLINQEIKSKTGHAPKQSELVQVSAPASAQTPNSSGALQTKAER